MSSRPNIEFIDQHLRLHVPHAVSNSFVDHVGRNSMDYQRLFLIPSCSTALDARVVAEDDNSSVALKPGTICIMAAQRPYRFEFPTGFHLSAFHFRVEFSGAHDIFNDFIPFKALATDAIDECDSAYEWTALRTPSDWLRAEGLLRMHVANSIDTSWAEIQDRIAGLRKWQDVLDDLASAPVSAGQIELLAKRIGISRHHFTRSFRKDFGCTPRDWHRRHLSKRVVAALMNQERTLADLADDFGFSDGFALSRFVSQSTGMSPSAIRQNGFFGN